MVFEMLSRSSLRSVRNCFWRFWLS